jgi:N-acetyl-alpha-D-muramate 1-phosphate uridylyltransferase
MNVEFFPMAILAGGLATRLRPLTDKFPKALLELNGEPFVYHQLRLLHRSGIERVVLCVAYRGQEIEEKVGDGRMFGLQVQYSYDGDKLRGTGGAVKNALSKLGESFFVLYGDSYLECDYGQIQSSFVKSGKSGLMTVHRNEDLWDKSNVEFTGGEIRAYDKIHRSAEMKHIDYGLGLFHRTSFLPYATSDEFDLASVYQMLLARGQLAAYEVTTRFYEIGSLKGIEDLANHLKKESEGERHDI